MRADKEDAAHPPASSKTALLPTALFMALTQKLDPACSPLSPPSETYSFDPWPGLSAWPLSHLKSFPPEGFRMQRGCPPSGPKPGVGWLMHKCYRVSKSPLLPLVLEDHFGGSSEPCLGNKSGAKKAGTCAFVTLLGSSSVVCSQKAPSVP